MGYEEDYERDESFVSEGRVRVRYRFGDKEMEVEGPPDYVNKHAATFLTRIVEGKQILADSGSENEEETSLLQAGQYANTMPSSRTVSEVPSDLVSFFRQKRPQSQRDEVLLITYFYQKYKGHDSLSLDEYDEAYKSLKRVAVTRPGNLKSSVRNVVDRTDYLYNTDRGRYALTMQGEELVERMDGDESNGSLKS